MPKLSIGIPVFNGQDFLPELLDSLLAQTFKDFEVVICDNASGDLTSQICGNYASRDPRIRYFRNAANLGAVPNYNRTFELSAAPLFKWVAHDDVYRETYLETCIDLLEQDPDAILAHTGSAFIDDGGKLLPFEPRTGAFIERETGKRYWADVPSIGDSPSPTLRFWQVLTRAQWGMHMFGVIRRGALQQTSLLPNFSGSDRAMLAELALLGRFRCASEKLFLKRLHAKVSWALTQEEIRGFLSTNDVRYSRRLRQIKAFFGAPQGKPIGILAKSTCFMLAAAHSARVVAHRVTRGDPRRAAYGYGWSEVSAPKYPRRTPST